MSNVFKCFSIFYDIITYIYLIYYTKYIYLIYKSMVSFTLRVHFKSCAFAVVNCMTVGCQVTVQIKLY